MTLDEIKEVLKGIECAPFSSPFYFVVEPCGENYTVQCAVVRQDINSGRMSDGRGGKGLIEPGATQDGIRQMAFGLILAYVNHEVREHFYVDGYRIFGPHMEHEKLKTVAKKKRVEQ